MENCTWIDYRFKDGNCSNTIVNNLEIHVQFSKVSQWLDYAEVKHLKLLEDYAQEQGLSWLARPPKSPPGDASVVAR